MRTLFGSSRTTPLVRPLSGFASRGGARHGGRLALATGVLAAVGSTLAATAPARAAGIPVTSLADNETADALCTLREAIKAVNTHAAYRGCNAGDGVGDTIFLPNGTILLGSTLPAVTAAVSISGGGHTKTIIDGAGSTQIAGISVGNSARLAYLSLRRFAINALTVTTTGSLVVDYVTIIGGGTGTSIGGCLNNAGSLTVDHSQIEGCDGFRGGVLNNTGTTALYHTTILKSLSEHSLIWNTNQLTVANVTIAANRVGEGAGAIMNFSGTTSISASTIAYNVIVFNQSTTASALNRFGGTLQIKNSVVFGNSGVSAQCLGAITSGGNNVYDSASTGATAGSGDRSVSDARLQPLTTTEGLFTNLPRAAGGVGRVYLPATNSPVLNIVPGFGVCGSDDQRGIGRIAMCDAGAVERLNALLVVGNLTLSSGDTILKTQLENLGFTVTTVLDSTSSPTNADNKRIVVISESVTSTNVNTKFRDVYTGVLVLEPWLQDDMQMTSAADLGTVDTNTVRVTNLPAVGFGGDTTLTNTTTAHGWGTPVSGATRFGYQAGTNRHFGYGYKQWDPMYNHTAPAFRAAFFSTNPTVPQLNGNGLRLLQEAILWTSQNL